MTKETDLPEEHVSSEENEEPTISKSPTEEIPEVSGEKIRGEEFSNISGSDTVPPCPEPPKKENKHKKIIKAFGAAVVILGGVALLLKKLASNGNNAASEPPSITPAVSEDSACNKCNHAVSQDCLNEVASNQDCSEVVTPSSNEDYTTILKTLGMIIVNMPDTWHHSEEKKLQADELGIPLEPNQTIRNKHDHPYRVKTERSIT